MHDDSFLPWALYGKSACILVPLPQRFREHGWLLPQLFPRSALAWRTRSASIDTNEASKELLFFSHNGRKKSCSKEELSILRTWLKGVVLPVSPCVGVVGNRKPDGPRGPSGRPRTFRVVPGSSNLSFCFLLGYVLIADILSSYRGSPAYSVADG